MKLTSLSSVLDTREISLGRSLPTSDVSRNPKLSVWWVSVAVPEYLAPFTTGFSCFSAGFCFVEGGGCCFDEGGDCCFDEGVGCCFDEGGGGEGFSSW